MKLLFRKLLGDLTPADDDAVAAMARLKEGATVTVEMKRVRNPQHLRLYWALVHTVHHTLSEQMAARYPTPETLHAALKVSLGVRTEFVLGDGTVGYIAGSVAFDKMTQDEFDAFFNRAVDAVIKYFLPGVTEDELRDQIQDMCGLRK